MHVKGTGIKTTRDFVKLKFESKYNDWINSLPPDSKKIYSGAIDIGGWFDINIAYYQPINKIASMFYDNNTQKAGDELGRHSAEIALKGIYKVFLLVATPQYLMKRAAGMMKAFYNPSEIDVSETSRQQIVMKIKNFEGINRGTEYRIAGWCARALELCNCKNVTYQFKKNLSLGHPETIIEFKWL